MESVAAGKVKASLKALPALQQLYGIKEMWHNFGATEMVKLPPIPIF